MEEARIGALLKEALALHQAGRLPEAAARYAQVLAQAPRQFDALHLLGVVRRQQGDAGEAVRLIEQALTANPAQATAHCNLGAALQDLGRSGEALAAYDTALKLNPGYALAWSNRGNALRKLGRLPDAVDSYDHALRLRPSYPEAWCNRAIALLDLGQLDAALESAECALHQKRPYAQAACVRANALFALRAFDAALRAYDEALALDARAPEAHAGRGLALLKLGRPDAALAAFDTALDLRPAHWQSHQQRADALLALGRREEAIAAYEGARALAPDPGQVDFALAALGVGTAPKQAPAAYVKALFDQYAGHFEEHLTGVLGYRTPALIGAALARHVTGAAPASVDLGCGTGLCAPFLRPQSRRLAGVDLSEKMLAQARAAGLYDELACADIGDYLAQHRQAFDLAVAADVLVYFGELDTLFGQVRAALRPGGIFCFSTEALEPGVEAGEFRLLPSNRYAHGLGYLERLAARQGFVVLEAESATVRSEHGADVSGHLLVLRAA